MTWIKTIQAKEAKGKLAQIYARVAGPDGQIDNILASHSLRPHTLNGHMMLYKSVLHHNGNSLDKSWLEALGVYVSYLNQCDYCVRHHLAGYSRLVGNEQKAKDFYQAVVNEKLESFLGSDHFQLFTYAKVLTLSPDEVTEAHIEQMRHVGFDDGEILEVNQVVAYFNYANRTVLGLGVSIAGEVLGMSPNDSDDENNWGHQ